jgi:hypothetical protein
VGDLPPLDDVIDQEPDLVRARHDARLVRAILRTAWPDSPSALVGVNTLLKLAEDPGVPLPERHACARTLARTRREYEERIGWGSQPT